MTSVNDQSAEATQAEVVAFLSSRAGAGRRFTTHGAHVFVAGGEAIKIKRAVRYPYLDFSTLELRQRACERELEVNRANAPQIYLGVVAITREADGRLAIGGAGEPRRMGGAHARLRPSRPAGGEGGGGRARPAVARSGRGGRIRGARARTRCAGRQLGGAACRRRRAADSRALPSTRRSSPSPTGRRSKRGRGPSSRAHALA